MVLVYWQIEKEVQLIHNSMEIFLPPFKTCDATKNGVDDK